MKEIVIYHRGELIKADERGYLSRTTGDGFEVKPSPNWRIDGALEFRKVFGNEVISKHYSFQDILDGKVPFQYKNGRQRCFIKDYDHGACRVWTGSHDVRVIENPLQG